MPPGLRHETAILAMVPSLALHVRQRWSWLSIHCGWHHVCLFMVLSGDPGLVANADGGGEDSIWNLRYMEVGRIKVGPRTARGPRTRPEPPWQGKPMVILKRTQPHAHTLGIIPTQEVTN